MVVTAIERDGTLTGPDTDGLATVLGATAIPLVASGGVGSRRPTWWPWPAWPTRGRGGRLGGVDRGQGPGRRPGHDRGGRRRVRTVRVIPCLDVPAVGW